MRKLLIGAVALSSLSGCLTMRNVTSVKDAPNSNVTLMETVDRITYFPFIMDKYVHQFWQCSQSGQELKCIRQCDGKTDLMCPAVGISGFGVATNFE